MQDLPPVVADDEKAVQNTKRERWDGEEIHCRNGLAMVSEERQPALHGIGISRSSPDPSRDTPFREIETQLEQFAVNAQCSPGRILGNHTENQGANLFADTLPSSYLADSGDPRPIQTKPGAMPVHDGSRSDQDERLPPPGPERSQRNPEQFVQGSQSTARLLRVQSQQLPTESQVLEDEVLLGTENADQPTEEMSERHDHSRNYIGKVRSELCAKSFILQVYDVLARHMLNFFKYSSSLWYPVRPAKTWNEIMRCVRSWLQCASRLRSFHCHQVRSKRERHLPSAGDLPVIAALVAIRQTH